MNNFNLCGGGGGRGRVGAIPRKNKEMGGTSGEPSRTTNEGTLPTPEVVLLPEDWEQPEHISRVGELWEGIHYVRRDEIDLVWRWEFIPWAEDWEMEREEEEEKEEKEDEDEDEDCNFGDVEEVDLKAAMDDLNGMIDHLYVELKDQLKPKEVPSLWTLSKLAIFEAMEGREREEISGLPVPPSIQRKLNGGMDPLVLRDFF